MRFISTGSGTYPTLLFIPGLSAAAQCCFGEVGRSLQNRWHIVLCELDGHYDGSPAFSGIDDACEQIERYVLENLDGQIHGIRSVSWWNDCSFSPEQRWLNCFKE